MKTIIETTAKAPAPREMSAGELAQVSGGAARMSCSNNLKQIGLAAH